MLKTSAPFIIKGTTEKERMETIMGRRKIEHPKTCHIRYRATLEEREELKIRCAMQGMSLAEYLRKLVELDKKEGYICKY